jgi:uncharacterized protein (DUF2267 family)
VTDLRGTVAAGDRVCSLRAIRDTLAASLEEAAPQYAAALAKQLADVMRELDQLQPPKQESKVDDLAARRAARRKKAAVPKRAASGKQRRTRSGGADGGGGPAV